MVELWVDIPGFDGYQLSNLGGLRSFRIMGHLHGRVTTPKPLQCTVFSKRYRMVSIRKPGDTRRYRFLLHRLLYGLFVGPIPEGMTVDHADGDVLNNRLENLRLATRSENSRNRKTKSEYKGVYPMCSGRWYASIFKEGKRYRIGHYDTAIEAARAYNEAALKYHGQFARLNAIES